MFGLNAILYSDDEIEKRVNSIRGTSSASTDASAANVGSSILKDLQKSCISFAITLGMNFTLGLLLIIPKKYEQDMMKAFQTKDKLILPGI